MRKKVIAAVIGTSALTAVAATSDAEAATYRVQAGDSLWSIATKHNISIAQLKSLNNLNSNLIFPNQVLQVSGGNTAAGRNTNNIVAGSTYTVRSGDSLSAIAARYGTTYQNIMRLNGLNSFLIYPGQQLQVSGTTATNQSTQSAGSAVTSNVGNSTYYTVQPGDSLALIASKYGTTYQNIMNLNGLSGFLIHPGQKLKVTGTAVSNQVNQTTQQNTNVGNTSYYTVQPGDSLALIASKYGTTYQNIMNLNGLSGFLIHPGQKLKVTGTATASQTQSWSTPSTSYTSPVFNHANLYDWGQCTWHVFNKRQAAGRPISTYWWNANAWDDNAARDGYVINNSPAVGSILQSDLGYYGHVAYVERINADGSILVSEMNYSAGPGVLTYRTVPSYSVYSFKYIH
ncbi:LysM peptidoglycan-binding domain-containing protein [Staphylococcus sp. GRT3]|uniref:LysM peptidoglycan-binding domain-containing protein n=1 Tax=Staphylococcus americanisciuri TaxID=2973940 RepID=A0ABT2EZW1_9STAP|nr:LysM peptidoglycan-binding domain-containing protein [Staphylococcus americanisciuri]MCS4485736.1 LysM peptidoglycan-binding domain-containing protein [Staphylococcus americanisciuri]